MLPNPAHNTLLKEETATQTDSDGRFFFDPYLCISYCFQNPQKIGSDMNEYRCQKAAPAFISPGQKKSHGKRINDLYHIPMIKCKKACADCCCRPPGKTTSQLSVHQSAKDHFFHKGNKNSDPDHLDQQITLEKSFLKSIGKMFRQMNGSQKEGKQEISGHSEKGQHP